ncbi:hypothetical protein WJX72_000008 [[Myrmecia] bisecta]|uniref:Cystatin domain-containing protein n=1 Tax=[Myrmecia] bisecta TaxID=41462 RepID=A0AAW1QB06_9CHLO
MKLLGVVLCLTFTAAAHAQLLGGWKVKPDHENDAHIQEVASFAVKQLSEKEGDQLTLEKVVSVHTQVVAGTNYNLVLLAKKPAGQVEQFEVQVYEPLPHTNQPVQLTQYKTMADGKQMVGGAKQLSTSDSDVVAAAKYATEQLSQQSNSLLPFELKEVVSAHSRVVNGVVYDLELKLAQGKREEVYQVEVVRSPKDEHSLKSSKKAPVSS